LSGAPTELARNSAAAEKSESESEGEKIPFSRPFPFLPASSKGGQAIENQKSFSKKVRASA
jgi:hypothetical protein